MARDRSLSVKLRADVSAYVTSMRTAGSATTDFTRAAAANAKANKDHWSTVGQSVTTAGLVMAAGLGLAVSRFADFDASMSAAGAATKATSRDLLSLRDAAMRAGADTQYSASEAAGAITELAKAGVSTADILAGGLTGALSLAAAGQIEVGKAAELAATAMTQFKLTGDKLPHVADLLAAGAGKAQGSVEDLGAALNQSGLVAAQTGLTIEETTGALAQFANAGLTGSDAGTAFKAMLQRLNPQSKEAADLMTQLGISAYDASGQFIGYANYAGQLQQALAKLTPEQRNAALATMFGSDAVRVAAIMYRDGATGAREWAKNVNDAGYAAQVAAQLTDNLRGDIERLTGSLDTALIKAGSGANETLRTMTKNLENVVNWFGYLPDSTQSSALHIAAAAAGITTFGGAAMIAVPKIQAFKASIDAMGITAGKSGAALKGLSGAFSLVAVASLASGVSDIAAAAQVADPSVDQLAKGLRDLAAGARESYDFGSLFARGIGVFRNDVEQTDKALYDFASHARAVLNPTFWDSSQAFFSGAGGRFAEEVKQLDAAFAQLATNGNIDEASRAFTMLGQAAAAQGVDIEQLRAQFPAYAAAMDKATAAQNAMTGSGTSTVRTVQDYLDAANGATQATKDFAEALTGFTSPTLDARQAARSWEESIDAATEALKRNGKTLDITTEKGRANQGALDGMARTVTAEVIPSMKANGASQLELQATLETSRKRIEEMAVKFGMGAQEAKAYAEKVASIPPAASTEFIANTSRAKEAVLSYKLLLDSLSDKTITITQRVVVKQSLAHGYDLNSDGRRVASGGYITGPGTATSDSIPAWLSNGEFVIRAAAVKYYGLDNLHAINAMRFADGGLVTRTAPTRSTQATPFPSASEIGAAVRDHLAGLPVEFTRTSVIDDRIIGRVLTAVGAV